MSKNNIIAIVVVLVLLIAGVLLFTSSNYSTLTNNNPGPQNTPTGSVSGNTVTVAYTDSGFSPKTVTVKKGDTVVFVDNASDAFRVASDPHPLHNGYPTTGGCVASTFDSCSNIAPGQSWPFVFDIVGSWGYHNHLNPSEKGTVIVQ
jgi:plastocyanin